MKRSPRPRVPSTFPVSIQQHLSAYTLAAGAAGVSLLAMAQPSAAEIIYTPANAQISRDGSYALDPNHDGIIDFVIVEKVLSQSPGKSFQTLGVRPARNNQAACRYPFCASTGGAYAGALSLGNEIGPSVGQHGWLGGPKQMAAEIRSGTFATYLGDFRYARGNYLGLRFQINGETHFGWARLTVRFHSGLPQERAWEAELTGYAYETVPDKPILAGQVSGDDAAAQPGASLQNRVSPSAAVREPLSVPMHVASLGTLARGANVIALWRKESVSEPNSEVNTSHVS